MKIFSANGASWDIEEIRYIKTALEEVKIHPQKEEHKQTPLEDELKLRQSSNTEKINPLKAKVLRVRGR